MSSMKSGVFTKPWPSASYLASTFACFIWARVFPCFIAPCTRPMQSRSRSVNFLASALPERGPCPGMTLTSSGRVAIAFSTFSTMPSTLPPLPTSTKGRP